MAECISADDLKLSEYESYFLSFRLFSGVFIFSDEIDSFDSSSLILLISMSLTLAARFAPSSFWLSLDVSIFLRVGSSVSGGRFLISIVLLRCLLIKRTTSVVKKAALTLVLDLHA